MEPKECRDLIGTAFASRPHPGDENIAHTDRRYPDYEGHRISDFLRGKTWQQITSETLLQDYQGDPRGPLFFTTDDGFRYYLPAFLLMALDPQGEEITDSLVFALTAPGKHKEEDLQRFHERMEKLTSDERAAVICTLHYLVEWYDREGLPDNPARDALRSYWEPS